MPAPRLLIIGPVFSGELVGGMSLALADITAQLRLRGWDVDDHIWSNAAGDSSRRWQQTSGNSRLAPLLRWPALFDLAQTALSPRMRHILATLCLSRPHLTRLAHNLVAAEHLLSNGTAYDAVLVCVDGAPPGLCALAAARHPRVAFLSLPGLAQELRSGWWRWARRNAVRQLGAPASPFLFQPIAAGQVRLALFASAQWRREALAAGIAPECAHTIYFGIPQPPARPRPAVVENRILWVGRLAPEKGLHHLLRALPRIRRELGAVKVTAIAGQGPSGYRRLIDRLIARHGLSDCVTILPAMDRDALQDAYATHDLLFFHSMFGDPVAFVLMEAFAAGLPVVASLAGPDARFVEPGRTCLCYRPGDPESLAAAMVTLLRSADLRRDLAARAMERVRADGSLAQMGAAFDQQLRQFLAGCHVP